MSSSNSIPVFEAGVEYPLNSLVKTAGFQYARVTLMCPDACDLCILHNDSKSCEEARCMSIDRADRNNIYFRPLTPEVLR